MPQVGDLFELNVKLRCQRLIHRGVLYIEICICEVYINLIPQHPECTEGGPDGGDDDDDDDNRDLSDTDDGSDQPFMVSVSSFSILDTVFATKHGKVVTRNRTHKPVHNVVMYQVFKYLIPFVFLSKYHEINITIDLFIIHLLHV